MNQQKIAIICLFVSIIWILIGPFLLVNGSVIDFTNTGQIGDTIGGITAPIIGLTSAILIYLSFTAQIKANEIIQEEAKKTNTLAQQQANFNYLVEEFERMKDKFSDFTHENLRGDEFTGYYALRALARDAERYIEEAKISSWSGMDLTNVDYLVQAYILFVSEVRDLNLSDNQRKIIQSKVWLHFAEDVNNSFKIFATLQTQKPERSAHKHLHQAYELTFRAIDVKNSLADFEKSLSMGHN